jgi:diguanylate cyclase (GGDEF)-like protein
LLAVLFLVIVAGLVSVQAFEIHRSAGRRIGADLNQGPLGRLVTRVVPEGPAAEGGLRVGDQVLSIDGDPTTSAAEYEVATAELERNHPVQFQVDREGRRLELTVSPGTPFPWTNFLLNLLNVFCYLGMGLLALIQGTGDPRARVLAVFSIVAAVKLSLPIDSIGNVVLVSLTLPAFFLLIGLEIGAKLHLAAVIPTHQRWLLRHRWIVPLFYVAGLGLGGLTALTLVTEEAFGLDWFPWTTREAGVFLVQVGVPLWATAVVVMLAIPAFTYPERRGRNQAALVLAGAMPWMIFTLMFSVVSPSGGLPLPLFSTVEPLALICYPLAVFIAIFRYHLFDLELVVRRSLIYTALTGLLVLVFYGAMGAGGALFGNLLNGGEQPQRPVWVIATATLILGLLFAPLRRAMQNLIDRRFFPERQALRRELVALAGELPALGKLPLMGEHLVASLCRIFAVESATVLIADPQAGRLVVLASTREPAPEALLLSLDDPALELLRRDQRPMPAAVVLGKSPSFAHHRELREAAYMAPLLNLDKLIGLVVVGPKGDDPRFPAEEVELLGLLSHHVATVLENARLFESATIESLTGLLRREAILEQLERELERAVRYRRPLTVGLADLDFFKEVNDHHGHLTGDSLLKRIAQAMATEIRATDFIGRYGGEEFLLILPETDLEGARTVAEKIRLRVESTRIATEDGHRLGVTVSVGLAGLRHPLRQESTPTPSVRELLAAADRALYQAKRAGRNRVCAPQPIPVRMATSLREPGSLA